MSESQLKLSRSFENHLLIMIVFLCSVLASCGGSNSSGDHTPPPSNIGGGFTLMASGGTMNDGIGTKGLVVLVTLRDSAGNGPGGEAWQLEITGPGISNPLKVTYDDGSPSSYVTWWWKGLNPLSGTYEVTALNGSLVLIYSFTLDATKTLPQTVVTPHAKLNKVIPVV